MLNSPYENLPKSSFWRTGVAQESPFSINNFYKKKWKLSKGENIATGGSCFAQHIAKQLKVNGFTVLDFETAPPGLPENLHTKYGFGMYSARYGNIYTVHQLLQIAKEVAGLEVFSEFIWEKEGKYFDAFRPNVEPNGLESQDEVRNQREYHLSRVRAMFRTMDVFVFTLGLTEAWTHNDTKTVYPLAPGTVAGRYDPTRHSFVNYGYLDIIRAFEEFENVLSIIRGKSQLPKFILTVSPVPLVATASDEHVLRATTYSKSVLRAVAGDLARSREYVDYFPSYEIITNPASRSMFYENNLRSVRPEGVNSVMRVFFSEHGDAERMDSSNDINQVTKSGVVDCSQDADDGVQCDEALLEAFNR